MDSSSPVLFLDVDGPLNPYAAARERLERDYAPHRMRPAGWPEVHPDLPVWLDPRHGKRLTRLADRYELVWATTWEDDANTLIAPLIGLPELPVARWPHPRLAPEPGMFWKTAPLVRYADGRPFAWVDDEIGEQDRDWVGRHHPAPALLHWIDPRAGLRTEDFATLDAWAATLG